MRDGQRSEGALSLAIPGHRISFLVEDSHHQSGQWKNSSNMRIFPEDMQFLEWYDTESQAGVNV